MKKIFQYTKMDKEILTFRDIEIEKKIDCIKTPVF